MDMTTIRASQLLAGRVRDTNANPDFSTKEPSFAALTPASDPTPASNAPNVTSRQLDFATTATAAPALRPTTLPEAARQVDCHPCVVVLIDLSDCCWSRVISFIWVSELNSALVESNVFCSQSFI